MSLEQAPEYYQASDLKVFISFKFNILSGILKSYTAFIILGFFTNIGV
jgi:hypothetical protein